MPFQSEKQRRYMHANLPDIANRWEAKYGLGGIAELNSQLNSLPEYYLPKNQGGRIGYSKGSGKTYKDWLNYRIKEIAAQRIPVPFEQWKKGDIKFKAQGGFIPSHEAGIYGLAEGGNIRLQPHTASDLLVQKTLSGERPKYQPPGHRDAPVGGPPGGGATSQGSGRDYSPPPTRAPDFVTGGEGTTKTTTTKDTGPKDGPKPHEGDWDPGWLNKDLRTNLDRLNDKDSTRYEKEQALVWLDQHDKKIAASEKARSKSAKTSGLLGFLGKGILTLATAGAGAGLFGKDIMKAASLYNKYKQAKQIKTAWDKGKIDLGFKEVDISNLKNKLTSDNQKLLASLPDGHPEKIELLSKMNIETPPTDDKGGSNIKIEDIETVNKTKAQMAKDEEYLKMERAAYLYYLEQQKRRQAYLDNYRQMFLANKGGLAGLFRVKTT